MPRRWLCRTLPAIISLAVPIARGEALPIINPSFETLSRPLAIGEQTNGAGGAGVPVATRFPFAGGEVSWADPVEVPGWRTLLRPPGDPAIIRAGVLNPPERSPGMPFMSGHDGQYLVTAQAVRMQQTIDAQLQPNTHYRLSFLAGIGLFDPDYIVFVSLLASPDLETFAYQGAPGVVTLVATQGVIPPPETFGTMRPYFIEYTSPAVLPAELAGRYLAIALLGSDGVPRVCFDDFRLEATRVPEPASPALLVAGVAALRRRWR
ncbi:MAG: hypothetical protein AB7Q17_11525 [Phycisphaerae bacterium]